MTLNALVWGLGYCQPPHLRCEKVFREYRYSKCFSRSPRLQALHATMPQGDKKLKKPDRKAKPVRGDQQKLRKVSGCPPIDQHPRDRRTDDCSHAPYLIFLRTQIS